MARRDVSAKIRRRRAVAAFLFVVVVGVVVGVSVAAVRHHSTPVPPPPPPPPKPFRIVFPEGFTRVKMGQRVRDVAKIADREHRGRVRLNEFAYLAATKSARVPCFGRAVQPNLEGFLFPATYDFVAGTTAEGARARPAPGLLPHIREGRSLLRAVEEPDPLRRAEDRLDDRGGGRGAGRPAEDRGGDLQPAARPDAAPDRRDAPLRPAHPADAVDHGGRARELEPRQHPKALRPAADSDRESRPVLAARRARPANVDYLYYVRIPGTNRHVFFENSAASASTWRPITTGRIVTTHVATRPSVSHSRH